MNATWDLNKDEIMINGIRQPIVSIVSVPMSLPPRGMKKVTNLYVNEDGKLVVVYDETPTP
jgi:hypothetical protein